MADSKPSSLADTTIEQFRGAYATEHARTKKVLSAFPAEQSEFKPHEKSNSARQLAWTFVVEEMMMLKTLTSEPVLGSGFPPPPDSWQTIVDQFDEQHERVMKQLRTGDGASLAPVKFFTGPKQTADFAAMDFLWFMLFDQIHHRGQMSSYLRPAGGKVPAIYGPSGDEPWF
jgi:uncharacterized damage-inducible protein DinB